jgi:ankyrin repeat protein
VLFVQGLPLNFSTPDRSFVLTDSPRPQTKESSPQALEAASHQRDNQAITFDIARNPCLNDCRTRSLFNQLTCMHACPNRQTRRLQAAVIKGHIQYNISSMSLQGNMSVVFCHLHTLFQSADHFCHAGDAMVLQYRAACRVPSFHAVPQQQFLGLLEEGHQQLTDCWARCLRFTPAPSISTLTPNVEEYQEKK